MVGVCWLKLWRLVLNWGQQIKDASAGVSLDFSRRGVKTSKHTASHQKLIHFGWCFITLATLQIKCVWIRFLSSQCAKRVMFWTYYLTTRNVVVLSWILGHRTPQRPPPFISHTSAQITGNRILVNYELHSPPWSRRHKDPPKKKRELLPFTLVPPYMTNSESRHLCVTSCHPTTPQPGTHGDQSLNFTHTW